MSPCRVCLESNPELSSLAGKFKGLCGKHADELIKENEELKTQLSQFVIGEVLSRCLNVFKG